MKRNAVMDMSNCSTGAVTMGGSRSPAIAEHERWGGSFSPFITPQKKTVSALRRGSPFRLLRSLVRSVASPYASSIYFARHRRGPFAFGAYCEPPSRRDPRACSHTRCGVSDAFLFIFSRAQPTKLALLLRSIWLSDTCQPESLYECSENCLEAGMTALAV